MNLTELTAVEILAPGVWNENKVTGADLMDIATASLEVGYIPPIKIGHADDPQGQAFGWVHNLRVIGGKLLADLKDVPEALATMIREKRYNAVSPEIFFNLKRDGKVYRRALKALAILGEQIPAVSGLKPLSEYVLSESTFDSVVFAEEKMTVHDDEITKLAQTVQQLSEQNALLNKAVADEQTAREAAANERADFQLKLTKIGDENRALKVADKLKSVKIPAYQAHFEALYQHALALAPTVKFSQADKSLEFILDDMVAKMNDAQSWMFKEFSTQDQHTEGALSMVEAGRKIVSLASKLVAEKGMTFSAAQAYVLAADPILKAAYTGVR